MISAGESECVAAEFRKTLLDSVSTDQLARITQQLAARAEGGDLDAIKVLLPYLVGRPAQSVELSGLEGEPVEVMSWVLVQHAILDALRPYPEANVSHPAPVDPVP